MKSVLHSVRRRIAGAAVRHPLAMLPAPRPGNPTTAACCTLPAETRAVARARAFARERLAAWRLADDTAEAASLIVSEFVTNSVMHSGAGDVTLRLARCCVSHLWIEVVDAGVWRIRAGSKANDLAEGGRGLALVAAMSEAFAVHHTRDGTRAWALLTAPAARPNAPP
ncbi:hypothetical protein GCM10009601_24280 [Streptomyces thermospinosisporus]|uniref:Histidine kinase/HSP90-like ATPase domain-containing protein n=1 Tax=Streptomyces thermospinosisporus TaxID=161482 RepID=A0ABP4JME2_9ACTN